MTRAAAKGWVPDRQDIIWIDCNPQAGHEMRDLHPMLVLSPLAFNARTGLVIGLSMATAAYNASNPFAVPLGAASGRRAGKVSYVLCHQPKTFDWRARHAKPHPSKRLARRRALCRMRRAGHAHHRDELPAFCVPIKLTFEFSASHTAAVEFNSMSRVASSRVSPTATQPGRSGT